LKMSLESPKYNLLAMETWGDFIVTHRHQDLECPHHSE
jgi:hypothetical protein